MKVKELIEDLQKVDPELEVRVDTGDFASVDELLVDCVTVSTYPDGSMAACIETYLDEDLDDADVE